MAQERIVYSDLKFRGELLDIAVFSPFPTGIDEHVLKLKEIARRNVFFADFASGVCNFAKMRHTGMLFCSGASNTNYSQGEPFEFLPCGGQARLNGDIISCRGCGVPFRLLGNQDRQLRNTMFYLMLKQMVPDLPCCNFVDCSITPDSDRYANHYAKLASIRSLGVVAVHHCLEYLRLEADGIRYCGLGFILAHEMRTRTHGPEKFGAWLQYLMREWHSLNKASEDGARALRYGPKPVRD